MLQVNDIIAFFQFRKINIQRGSGGNRVRRLEPARALDFVASENFRIGDDDELRLVAHEATRERAQQRRGPKVEGRGLLLFRLSALGSRLSTESIFLPDFHETLPL